MKNLVWMCEFCGDDLKTKTSLIEHLQDHINGAREEESTCESQLDELEKKYIKIK
jgi:hypothetical protein